MNADVGGYVARDRLWWYASVRQQAVSSRLVAFPVKPIRTEALNVSVKGDARLSPNHELILFGNVARTNVPNFLDGFGAAGGALAGTTINLSEESTSERESSGSVVKAEWQWMRNAMFTSVRVGRFAPRRDERPHGSGPRFENATTGVVSGGNRTWEATLSRPQLQASTSYFKDGWYGRHQVKAGLQILFSTESQYLEAGVSRRRAPRVARQHVRPESSVGGLSVRDAVSIGERAVVVLRLRQRVVAAARKAVAQRRGEVRLVPAVSSRADEPAWRRDAAHRDVPRSEPAHRVGRLLTEAQRHLCADERFEDAGEGELRRLSDGPVARPWIQREPQLQPAVDPVPMGG